ncbi:MAG: hypothetical protein KKD63_15750 [Proteobacteria bacterium]|nr:hypothetical protein [Desulfobulbaceae bacterium]MBU4154324.1 hypothetical protein [Pseudomonadota bacterium]
MAENDNEHDVTANQKTTLQNASSLAAVKVILEFVSKCFYPAITAAVLVMLWTPLSSIDISGLILRLQSVKAGNYELAFSQAQDVGAEIAPLNGRIAELERIVASLQTDLKRTQEVTKVTLPQQEVQARKNQDEKFKANSQYTILVFHRRESRDPANLITQALLKGGYVSSDTETDFSELKKVTPSPNLIFITYTVAGQQVLEEVEALVRSVAPNAEVRYNPQPISLRRGDIQVMAF